MLFGTFILYVTSRGILTSRFARTAVVIVYLKIKFILRTYCRLENCFKIKNGSLFTAVTSNVSDLRVHFQLKIACTINIWNIFQNSIYIATNYVDQYWQL